MSENAPPDIFDMRLRARHRDRAHPRFRQHDFLYRHMLDELFDRLDMVTREFRDALVVGCPDLSAVERLRAMGMRVTCADPGERIAGAAGGIHLREDALSFTPDSFDLILSCGTLDSVNDLPGALVQMRHILRNDGLLLAAMAGGPSFPMLKASLLAAEGDRAGPHVHPQIELRSAGDLLQRTGFALPVADEETVRIRYSSLLSLMADLRGMGAANCMVRRGAPLTRGVLERAVEAFGARADIDGKTTETVTLLYLTGWKPDPSQPRPARRGSGQLSLAQALKGKEPPA